MRCQRLLSLSGAIALLAPHEAAALTFSQFVGLFHVVVGLLLTVTLGVFIAGIAIYFARLNTWPSYRDHAIKMMIWGLAMLSVLILLIALVQFIQRHTTIALTILAVAAILAVVILIARMSGGGGGEKKTEGGGGARH